MKKTTSLVNMILFCLAYMAYLLLEGPIKLFLEGFSLPILYQGYLSNLILLLPLLLVFIFLLFKLNLQKGLTTNNKRIFLIPVAFLLFVVATSFSAFKSALSFEIILFLFGLCLVGFTEEFFFRGILFPKLTNAFSSVYIGAIISSFLFGIVHYINLINNPESINAITSQVIYAFCGGILMCGIFYKTKNLIVLALIHTILNLQSQIRTWDAYRTEQMPMIEVEEVLHPSLWEILSYELNFNIFCLIAGFILIYHQNRKEKNKIRTAIAA